MSHVQKSIALPLDGRGQHSVRRWPGLAALYRIHHLWQSRKNCIQRQKKLHLSHFKTSPDIGRGGSYSQYLGLFKVLWLGIYFWGLVEHPVKESCGVRGILYLQWEHISSSAISRKRPVTSGRRLASKVCFASLDGKCLSQASTKTSSRDWANSMGPTNTSSKQKQINLNTEWRINNGKEEDTFHLPQEQVLYWFMRILLQVLFVYTILFILQNENLCLLLHLTFFLKNIS